MPLKFFSGPEPAQGRAADRIEVSDLTKVYRRKSGALVHALDHVSIRMEPGEFLVLLGPSGCGKTTLLRSIAGLEVPSGGRIEIGERPVFDHGAGIDVPSERRSLSMMFQSYALWPHMAAVQNVSFPLESRGIAPAEARRRAKEALDLVGIGELALQFPSQMSGGQQQRVALARALVAGDGLILFDEPLSNVDAKIRERLRLELTRMHRQMGFSAVYVTHDRDEALVLADRVAVMRGGRVVQVDRPQALYEAPGSLYVAAFLGAVNVVPARVAEVSGHCAMTESLLGRLPARLNGWIPATGDRIALAIRPEAVDLAPDAATGRPEWTGRVLESAFMGHRWIHLLDVAGAEFQAWGPGPLQVDTDVRLAFDMERIAGLPLEAESDCPPSGR